MTDILHGQQYRVDTGDCLTRLRELPDGCCDCCVTSPPYNHLGPQYSRGGGMHKGKACVAQWIGEGDAEMYQDAMPEEEYRPWLVEVITECLRVTRGLVWVNHKTRYRNGVGIHPLTFLPFPVYSEVVWNRGGSMALNCRRFAPSHEYFFGFGKPHYWDDQYNGLCSVWAVSQVTGSDHPCPYPEDLVRPLICASCPPDGIVLDPFTGSGTTGAVSLSEGRRFYGMEKNATFAAMARRRIAGWRHKPRRTRPQPPPPGQAALFDEQHDLERTTI